uniref:RRM domain-containing protein n=1 Tax=Panagrolaimus superbus TaxID=310955 RepID=A0A914XYG2_9BILA
MLYKWGIVCSVQHEDHLVDKIIDFFEWMLPCLTENAEKLMLIREFEDKPSFVFRCDPEHREQVEEAYARAELKHPQVIFVFHILPYRNSKEFNWLKEFSKKHWQVGQGILVDNVFTKFDGSPLHNVFANMNQYMSRRLHEVMSRKRPENKNRVLYVNSDKSLNAGGRYDEIADSVRLVLHNNRFISDEQPSNTIIASGYPPSYNHTNIISLFDKLHIRTLQCIRPNVCFVEFENDTQAVQALLNRHGYDLGGGYYLDLQPTSSSLRRRVLEAKTLWQQLGVAEKFPYA